jgi:hypothetical protein
LKTAAKDDMALQAIFTSSDYCLYTSPKNHEVVNLSSVGFQTNETMDQNNWNPERVDSIE